MQTEEDARELIEQHVISKQAIVSNHTTPQGGSGWVVFMALALVLFLMVFNPVSWLVYAGIVAGAVWYMTNLNKNAGQRKMDLIEAHLVLAKTLQFKKEIVSKFVKYNLQDGEWEIDIDGKLVRNKTNPYEDVRYVIGVTYKVKVGYQGHAYNVYYVADMEPYVGSIGLRGMTRLTRPFNSEWQDTYIEYIPLAQYKSFVEANKAVGDPTKGGPSGQA